MVFLELNSRLPLLLFTIIPDFFSFLIEIQPVIGIRIRGVVAGAVCTLPHPNKRMFIIHI